MSEHEFLLRFPILSSKGEIGFPHYREICGTHSESTFPYFTDFSLSLMKFFFLFHGSYRFVEKMNVGCIRLEPFCPKFLWKFLEVFQFSYAWMLCVCNCNKPDSRVVGGGAESRKTYSLEWKISLNGSSVFDV